MAKKIIGYRDRLAASVPGALGFLIAEGRQITSSQELGDRLGISSR